MAIGSLVASVALLVAGTAANGPIFAVAIVIIQVAGTLVLYDAAFTALVQVTGTEARKRITHLTLIAGFASTLFWPLTSWLDATLGWRTVFVVFAVGNLTICVPLHVLLWRWGRILPQPADGPLPEHAPARSPVLAMWLTTIGFALSGFALAAILAQMVPLLSAVGLGAGALLVSALFGPAQVLVRFVNLLLGAARHPIGAALLALGLVPIAIAALAVGAPAASAAVLFAAMLGFGSGLKSIVQGSLPLALFGRGGYGARLGVMASVRQVLASVAPFSLAFLIEILGVRPALWIIAAVGFLGLLCLLQVAGLVGNTPSADFEVNPP